ncbi:MAG: hypothetical protein IJO97_04300 [Lachnospiraceae bacterium]|nr:hypothetical protein [Lachnospiraceae bacterium]
MPKNLNLLLDVTSIKFVALFCSVFHSLVDDSSHATENPKLDFYALLFTIESFSLPELLDILIVAEQPLLAVALFEGVYLKTKKEYLKLIEHLKNTIENSTGEEA